MFRVFLLCGLFLMIFSTEVFAQGYKLPSADEQKGAKTDTSTPEIVRPKFCHESKQELKILANIKKIVNGVGESGEKLNSLASQKKAEKTSNSADVLEQKVYKDIFLDKINNAGLSIFEWEEVVAIQGEVEKKAKSRKEIKEKAIENDPVRLLEGLIKIKTGRSTKANVNTVDVDMYFSLKNRANKKLIAMVKKNSSAYAGDNVDLIVMDLVSEAAGEVADRLYADVCSSPANTAGLAGVNAPPATPSPSPTNQSGSVSQPVAAESTPVNDGPKIITASQIMSKTEYINKQIRGPRVIVLSGQVKNINTDILGRLNAADVVGYAETELTRANFGVLERGNAAVDKMLGEMETAFALGDPKAAGAVFKKGALSTSSLFIKFDIVKAEVIGQKTSGVSGEKASGFLGGFLGSIAGAAAKMVKTEDKKVTWLVGLQYKILDGGTTEVKASDYIEVQAEVNTSEKSVGFMETSDMSIISINTIAQHLIQQAVLKIDSQYKKK
jgi:hypothetical protein